MIIMIINDYYNHLVHIYFIFNIIYILIKNVVVNTLYNKTLNKKSLLRTDQNNISNTTGVF